MSDLRALAKRRTPRPVFDYTDGAAGEERAADAARAFLDAVQFRPRVLRDVSQVDLSVTIAGSLSQLPVGLAPTGFTRMMNHEGETAVVRAAARAGVPYALSTMGTTSVEAVAKAAPDATKWFQLYLWRDREASKQLIERASAAGYTALVLTVDTPVAGPRLRDARNGLTLPPSLTVRTVLDTARKPRWWLNMLSTDPLEFATFTRFNGTVAELANKMFDPSLSMSDLVWLREQWAGTLIVKGIQNADDATMAVDAGADAVIVSNHGGRQLDRAGVPVMALPEICEAIGGRAQVIVDSGIMSGSDAVIALCMGADFVMVGRAYLYGLMAGGERGVDRALTMFRTEMVNTMQLLGASKVADLGPDMLRLPHGS